MHRRFERARRTAINCPAGPIEVAVAESFRLRLVGLAGLDAGEIEPLLFPRCRSVHTFGMKAPIDVVWLEGERVIGVLANVPPRRHARAPACIQGRRRDIAALELAPGYAARLGLRASTMPPKP